MDWRFRCQPKRWYLRDCKTPEQEQKLSDYMYAHDYNRYTKLYPCDVRTIEAITAKLKGQYPRIRHTNPAPGWDIIFDDNQFIRLFGQKTRVRPTISTLVQYTDRDTISEYLEVVQSVLDEHGLYMCWSFDDAWQIGDDIVNVTISLTE